MSVYSKWDQNRREQIKEALRPPLTHFAFAVSDTQRTKSSQRRFETRNKYQFTAAKHLEHVRIVPLTT